MLGDRWMRLLFILSDSGVSSRDKVAVLSQLDLIEPRIGEALDRCTLVGQMLVSYHGR